MARVCVRLPQAYLEAGVGSVDVCDRGRKVHGLRANLGRAQGGRSHTFGLDASPVLELEFTTFPMVKEAT